MQNKKKSEEPEAEWAVVRAYTGLPLVDVWT